MGAQSQTNHRRIFGALRLARPSGLPTQKSVMTGNLATRHASPGEEDRVNICTAFPVRPFGLAMLS
jgi:hypothetical protein